MTAFSSLAMAANDARDSDSPFGVLDFGAWDHDWNYHHYTEKKLEKAAKLMKEAGIRWVRLDFLWNDMEVKKGQWDFEKYDKIVAIYEKYDVKVLGILGYNNTNWAAKNWNLAPDQELFSEYCWRVVEHFKDRVKYWEVWNEPDSGIYWQPQDDQKAYTLLLKEAYESIKAEDPTAKVVMGSASQDVPKLLRRLYQLGAKDSFDVVNIHPFIDPLRPDAKGALRGMYRSVYKLMQKYGDEKKPIWFTEIGAPGVKKPSKKNAWWMGKSPTEAQQAKWVRTVYEESLKWEGVGKVFWAFFRDTHEHFKSGTDYFGLIREDFSLKPAYKAYAQVTAEYYKKRSAVAK